MRKNIVVLTAGIAASLMIATGCSSKATSETTAAVATEASTETETAVDEKAGEGAAEGETSEAGTEAESSEEAMEEINVDVPIKIWGEITEVTEDTIVVDNQSEDSSLGEMILTIDPENTLILDAETGFPTSLDEIEGETFEAYIGPAMTMSLPPQTTPYVVVVNIAEDMMAPQYLVAAGAVEEKDGALVLAGNDGTEFEVMEDAVVEPFKTKNIVTMEDIHEGTRCLVWTDEDGAAERIALFAE